MKQTGSGPEGQLLQVTPLLQTAHEIDPIRSHVLSSSERPTVLVAEDEAILRDFARFLLVRKGYVVLVAEDGAEALQIAERHAGRIHLLFTDVVMPRLGGAELGREICRIFPDIAVLYTSGYPRDVMYYQGITDPDFEFLPKPYTAQTLVQRVAQLLPLPTAC